MTREQITKLIRVLSDVENYLHNDIDAICDDEYLSETQALLKEVKIGIDILAKGLQ